MARQPSDLARTLDRGLQVLETLAAEPTGLTLGSIAERMNVHRTIVHRLLRTLAAHNLVKSDEHKRYELAIGMTRLAAGVDWHLRSVAVPLLKELADTVKATANVAVADGADVVVVATVEPRTAEMHVAFRAGQSHPLDYGSAGLAILMSRPAQPGERDEVKRGRDRGYVVTRAEVVPGTWGVSAPVSRAGDLEASVGVSLFGDERIEWIGGQVQLTARRLAEMLADPSAARRF